MNFSLAPCREFVFGKIFTRLLAGLRGSSLSPRAIFATRELTEIMEKRKIFFIFLLFLGLFLFAANMLGVIRADHIWPSPPPMGSLDDYRPFSRKEFNPARGPGEDVITFATRMNLYVHRHTRHYFFDKNTLNNIDVMSAPFSWSWPLWVCGFFAALTGEKFSVEFCDSERGLERGYGYCSQRALILQDILRKNRLPAEAVDLDGHVVCLLHARGNEIVLDPDFGTIIPHSLEFIRNNPEILEKYMNENKVGLVRSIYEAGHWLLQKRSDYHCFSNFDLLAINLVAWLVPLALIIAGFLGLRRKALS